MVVLARTNSSDNVVFGHYVVDYLCTGVKDTAFATNVSPDVFDNEVSPSVCMAVFRRTQSPLIWRKR